MAEQENNINFMQVVDENGNPKPPQQGVFTTTSNFITDEDRAENVRWFASEENRQKGLYLAQQIKELMRGKWFTLDSFVSKLGVSLEESLLRINICKGFNNIEARMGGPSDGPGKNGKQLFKISLNAEDELKAIDDMIKYHQDQINVHELRKKSIVLSA